MILSRMYALEKLSSKTIHSLLSERNQIIICCRSAELVEYDGYVRLAFPNLETWQGLDSRPSLLPLHDEVQWNVRMEKHCQFMADLVIISFD